MRKIRQAQSKASEARKVAKKTAKAAKEKAKAKAAAAVAKAKAKAKAAAAKNGNVGGGNVGGGSGGGSNVGGGNGGGGNVDGGNGGGANGGGGNGGVLKNDRKNVHSRAYHKSLSQMRNDGWPEQTCKERARMEAKLAAAEWDRAQQAAGAGA